jgi:hypothetical protein
LGEPEIRVLRKGRERSLIRARGEIGLSLRAPEESPFPRRSIRWNVEII